MTYPSIFSRLYETEKAFMEVADAIQHGRLPDQDSERIVDACLNILELLSKPNCYVKIIPIGLRDIREELLVENPHTRFLNNIVMEDSDNLFDLEGGDRMGVIMLNDTVIGGLSPLTLVYSRPDLDRVMPNDDRASSRPHSLMHRHESFIQLMAILVNNDYLPDALKNYVTTCIIHHGHIKKDHPSYYSDSTIDRLERTVYQDGQEITIGGFPIFRQSALELVSESDYLINSNKKYESDNNTPIPLALGRGKKGIFRYINGFEYIDDINIYPDPNDIRNRILPGTGIQYPYLTEDDFLEEYIIEYISYSDSLLRGMLYPIDEKREVMLPLKRLFFDYFKAEDVERLLRISFDEGSGTYTVGLKVPVSGGEVEFHKRYYRDSIVEVDSEMEFNLAVTPFNATEHLPYHAICFQSECSAELRFFKSDSNQETATLELSDDFHRDGLERLTFVTIKGTWDYMAINITKNHGGEATGAVIPKWNTSPIPWGTKIVFSVLVADRAVSVTYSSTGAMHQLPLSLDRDNSFCAMAESQMFERMMNGMFVSFKNDDKPIGLRIPTSVNRMKTDASVSMLNGCNIAFDVAAPLPKNWQHISNIFRSNQNHIANNDTVKCYCDEIAWLIKMACIEKGINTAPEIQIELPRRMTASEATKYRNLWLNALSEIDVSSGNIKFIPAHAARFSAIMKLLPHGKDTIIVDIDAYHITLAYKDPNTEKFQYRILPFGINDLYGLNDLLRTVAVNGYVDHIFRHMNPDIPMRVMIDRQQDSLDILEHAIEIKDQFYLYIPEMRVPYLLFINAIKNAIIQFAISENIRKYGIIFCGYGMKFLEYFQPLMEDLQEFFEDRGEVEDIRMIASFEKYLQLDFDYSKIPDMGESEEIDLCDGQKLEDLHHFLDHDIKEEILDKAKKQIEDKDTPLGNCLDRVRIDKEGLMRVLKASYERCLHEFMQEYTATRHSMLTMSEAEIWPYRYSLTEFGCRGNTQSFPFY